MAKGAYVGVETQVPIYDTETVNVTADNIGTVFTVTNGSTYYFAGSGDTFTTNNKGVNSSTATTTLTALKDMDVSFTYSYSSEANYDKFTLKIAGTTVENAVSGTTTTKTWSGSLTAGQTIEFTYAKDSSTHSNDDKCTFSGMTCVTKVQTGTTIKSLARKIKKGYLGIEGVARKIKKAYIGIGGVARPCFGGGKLAYWGSATLSDNRRGAYGAVTSKHALFAGGDDGTTPYFTLVDVFDDSLTQTTTSLGEAKKDHGAESIGGHAIFAGGQYKFGSSYKTSKVYAFDDSLTRKMLDSLSTSTTIGNRNAHVGNYAIFHTGSTNNVYDSSLTRTTVEGFTVSTVGIGVSHKNHALFSSQKAVNVYDASLTHTVTATSRSYAYHAGASNGNHALIGGPTYVEVFDASLTRTDAADLEGMYEWLNAVSLEDHIIFAGGYYSGEDEWGESSAVNSYDASLTKTVQTDLSIGRGHMGVAAIGNFALFCGGHDGGGSDKNAVDIFTVV